MAGSGGASSRPVQLQTRDKSCESTLVQSAVLHIVCLSVTFVDRDQIGWNSSEIISPLVSLGCSLSADPNIRGLLQGEHSEILTQSDLPLC